MTTIVTRAGKGSPLTNAEMDTNLTNLNTYKAEKGGNRIINGNLSINQRAVSGTVTLAAGAYGHDRFKAGASGCTYTFATSANVTTITISAGSLQQVIEGVNLETGTYCLSWGGTSTGKIGAGSYSASGITGSITGGTDTTVEFSTGTLNKVQLELGSVATTFEQRPIGLELGLCQRYYWKTYNQAVAPGSTFAAGGQAGAVMIYVLATGNTVRHTMPYKVNMRAAPTITLYNPETGEAGYGAYESTGATNQVALSVTFISDYSAIIYSTAAGFIGQLYWCATASAEL